MVDPYQSTTLKISFHIKYLQFDEAHLAVLRDHDDRCVEAAISNFSVSTFRPEYFSPKDIHDVCIEYGIQYVDNAFLPHGIADYTLDMDSRFPFPLRGDEPTSSCTKILRYLNVKDFGLILTQVIFALAHAKTHGYCIEKTTACLEEIFRG